jgi:hypothetical protein
MKHLLEVMHAHPNTPQAEFPGYSSAQLGAAARLTGQEGWQTWALGGFRFADGSVLYQAQPRLSDPTSGWHVLNAAEAEVLLQVKARQRLEVYLMHVFEGRDERMKRSVAEGCFVFDEHRNRWQLVIEYEAFMDSPLCGFRAERMTDLLELSLLGLLVDTAQPSQRWRLEQVGLHPDWLELLPVSRAPG